MKFKCVFIIKEYFKNNKHFVEMLDPDNLTKQSNRKYIFLEFKYKENNLLIPLRSEMPNISKLGQVGYKVPSEYKPNAGLDYRKILIINDENYIEEPKYIKIPKSQVRIIEANYNIIEKQVIAYVEGYIKAVKKNRHLKDKKFCYSTLHNFHKELKIDKLKEVKKDFIEENKEVAITKTVGIKDIIKKASKKANEYNKKNKN